ncbi:hypothetical protein CR513_35217, partial [Mucuna pruriens]
MPKEISKLRKLRHLLADKIFWIQLGGMTSLQKLRLLNIDRGFEKLKELELKYLYNLNSIFIDRGALHSLKKLQLMEIPKLKTTLWHSTLRET